MGKKSLISGERKCSWKFKRESGHSQETQGVLREGQDSEYTGLVPEDYVLSGAGPAPAPWRLLPVVE